MSCWSPAELAIHDGDQCVVARGDIVEFGRVMEIEERDAPAPAGRDAPRLLRRATLQDQSKAEENVLHSKMALKSCGKIAERMGLKIRLVRGHYSFDRSVLMVEFTSEERLDLRELARQIGEEVRARVELKQLGVRDEAGIIGGMGPCGRELCCSSWIRRFASINVKMAKTQGLSLNPAAIGGCCGRLKCCLGYEYETYRELSKHVPAKGARVRCPEGEGCVEDRSVLRQEVRVFLDDKRVVQCRADEVREIWNKNARRRREPDDAVAERHGEADGAGEAEAPPHEDESWSEGEAGEGNRRGPRR